MAIFMILLTFFRPGADIPKIVEKCEAMFSDIHSALKILDEAVGLKYFSYCLSG